MRDLKRILIAGEGGQGVQTIAKVLATSAYLSGKKIAYIANYGVEQRGGVSLGFVQISNSEIGFPKFQYADILVILIERAVPRTKEYIKNDTVIVYDEDLVSSKSLESLPNKKIKLSALKIAKEKMIGKVFDIIVLGALSEMVKDIDRENVKEALHKELEHKYDKRPELKHFNEMALETGLHLVAEKEKVHG